MVLFESAICLVVVVLGYIYLRSKKPITKHLFDEHGIPFRPPRAIFGSYGDLMQRKENFYDFILNLYDEYQTSSVFGIFFFNKPVLVLNDMNLIKQVLVKDFDHFADHPNRGDPEVEPILFNSLFMLSGDKWRDMRSTLSPAFTGNKMRQMFQLIVECSERTVDILRAEADNSRGPWVPELRELFSYFANDVIATAAFGVEVNSVQDKTNRFYQLGKKSLDLTSFKFMLRSTLAFISLKVSRKIAFRTFPSDVVQFFDGMVHDTIASREKNNIYRPDMIQLLMEARAGTLKDDTEMPDPLTEDVQRKRKPKWSNDDITAQCYLFFLAGFETISGTLSMLCQQLMEHPDIQKRVHDEVDELRRHLNGATVGYDDLSKLKYMDMVISETLRKFPTPMIDRECVQDYPVTTEDGRTFVLPKGTSVLVPVVGIHRDPKYYPNPEIFDPERFSDENKHSIEPFTYMPFGLGPRSCIGVRMALMELKAFLFLFLSSFTLERASNTEIPMRFENAGLSMKTADINIHLKPRRFE